MKKTSEEVGHSRTSVIAAYCGRFIRVAQPNDPDTVEARESGSVAE